MSKYKVLHPITRHGKTYMSGKIIELPEEVAKYIPDNLELIPDEKPKVIIKKEEPKASPKKNDNPITVNKEEKK